MAKYFRMLCVGLSLAGSLLCADGQTQPPTTKPKPDFSQEAFVVEQDSTHLTFAADGTGTRESTARVRIQSDAGKQRFGLLTFPYQSSTESVEVSYVRVRKPDDTVVMTPAENVQDMPAAVTREAPFYSDLREKHVAVKGLGSGDVLEYQLRWQITKPLVPGHFWFAYTFSSDTIELQEQLQISVPRERPVKYKSPAVAPVISEEGAQRIYTWTRSNLEHEAKDEEPLAQLQNRIRGRLPGPDVQLSSFQSWEDIGRWYGGLQQERIQPSTEIRAKAIELTRNANDDAAKLEAIYRYVAQQFRYIGIAFGIGRYQPHNAGEVLSNQYGDCKDKHTLLASLLQVVGITAYPALVSTTQQLDPLVPTPGQVNHVISVIPQKGGYLWLDTTTEVAPLGYLLTPLRDKPALVIPGDRPATFVTTPSNPPMKFLMTFHADAELHDTGILESTMERAVQGDESEVVLRTGFRNTPLPQWKDLAQQVSYASGFAGTVSEVTASPPEATHEPFRISYHYTRKDYPDWKNRRISPPLPPIVLPILKEEESQPSEPIWLGPPGEFRLNAKVELPKGYTPELPAAINLTHDFAEYHAAYAFKNGALLVERTLVTKLSEVPIAEYDAYKAFRKAANDDHDRFLDLSSADTPKARGPEALAKAAWSLPDSQNPEAARFEKEAREAAMRGEMQAMIAALKRAVAADPKFIRAWLMLAGSYMAMDQVDSGLDALRKAVATDPKQPLPLKMLGFALMQARRYEDAAGTWLQFIQLAPDDLDGYANLGVTFLQLKRYTEAISFLQRAVDLNPDRPALQADLGRAYLGSGDDEKAMAAFRKVIDSEHGWAMKNDLAYELALANKRLPEALQYAEQAVRLEGLASEEVKLDQIGPDELQHTVRLGAYWDTLGWVHFRLGNLDRAEKYLEAAWNLLQGPVEGDHLGQVYEQQHRTQAAIHMYKLAIAAQGSGMRVDDADIAETRARLRRLGGSYPTAPAVRNDAPEELSRLRTTTLNRIVRGSASAEFFILFAPGPKVEDVKFISGSEKLQSAGDVLRSTTFRVVFPDNAPARLLRKGVLACFQITGCSFVLFPPERSITVPAEP